MHGNKFRIVLLSVLALVLSSVVTPANLVAGNITWATGVFSSDLPFYVEIFSPDGLWDFNVSVNAPQYVVWGPWICGQTCERDGAGYFLAGTASGDLSYWNGSAWILQATFSGVVPAGGSINDIECLGCAPTLAWDYEYYYSFYGAWTNQWQTDASVYAWDRGGYCCVSPGGEFTLTTSTPEPGTLFMLGSGVLGLAGIVRRKLVV
jgi:hypothetical protein